MLLLAVIVIFAGAHTAAEATILRLSHHRPVDSYVHKDAVKFAEDVKQSTDGRVQFKIYPASQLGTAEVAFERTSMGALESVIGYPVSEIDPHLDIYVMPGLANNFTEVEKVYGHGSPFRKLLDDLFLKQNMYALFTYMTDFKGVAFRNIPQNIDNVDAKRPEKIRTPVIDAYRFTAESLGYHGTTLPWSEVFTGLQTGVIDGAYGAGSEQTCQQLRDVVKCFVPINLQADVYFYLINKDVFDKLSKEDQALLRNIGIKHEKARFAQAAADQKYWDDKLRGYGKKVVVISNADREVLRKKAMSYAWPKLRKEIGAEFFDKAVEAWKKSINIK